MKYPVSATTNSQPRRSHEKIRQEALPSNSFGAEDICWLRPPRPCHGRDAATIPGDKVGLTTGFPSFQQRSI
jgi:hypothetical protein